MKLENITDEILIKPFLLHLDKPVNKNKIYDCDI